MRQEGRAGFIPVAGCAFLNLRNKSRDVQTVSEGLSWPSRPATQFISVGNLRLTWSELLLPLLDRLQYFARGLQVYIRQLRVALQGKTGDALKTEEVTTP